MMTDASGYTDDATRLMDKAAEVVAAFVGNNSLPVSELSGLIARVHAALVGLTGVGSITAPALLAPASEPAVPIKKSVTADYLVCLEDGHRFRTLKRHLKADHGLTPASYRAKWNLPNEYPMVAPGYAKARSELAKRLGLGQQRRGTKKKSLGPRRSPSPSSAEGDITLLMSTDKPRTKRQGRQRGLRSA